MSFQARDGMNGNLDYSFLGTIMGLMSLDPDEQLEIIAKVNRVEAFLRNKAQNKGQNNGRSKEQGKGQGKGQGKEQGKKQGKGQGQGEKKSER